MIARDAWRRRDEDHVLHEPEPLAGRQVGEQLKRVPHDASAERDPEQRERAVPAAATREVCGEVHGRLRTERR